MHYCHECDRWFDTENGYNQHMNNSASHAPEEDWDCDYCQRTFGSQYALQQHCANSLGHPYCIECKRLFQNQNNLNQHMHSKIHVGSAIQCPFCKNGFSTASGVTIHLESGTCPNANLDRHKINTMIQRMDAKNIITRPMLTLPVYSPATENIATERAWNGYAYACYLCPRQFASLQALNSHMKSPAHEQHIYKCPKAACGRNYKLLSGLVQHVESEVCGVMRFETVQKQAKNGIQNMAGRMIMG